MERVAAIATLGDGGASGKAEALDALQDVIGHPAHYSRACNAVGAPAENASGLLRLGRDSILRMRCRPIAPVPGLQPTRRTWTPQVLTAWLSAFRDCFTAPVWNHVLVLVAGAVLAPG